MARGQIWQNFPKLLRFMAFFPSLLRSGSWVGVCWSRGQSPAYSESCVTRWAGAGVGLSRAQGQAGEILTSSDSTYYRSSQNQESPRQTKPKKGPKRKVHEFCPFLRILVFLLRKTSAIHIELLFWNAPAKSSWTDFFWFGLPGPLLTKLLQKKKLFKKNSFGAIISTSDFQSEVGEVFGEIGGELPAKFRRRFSSFFCLENRQKHFPPKLHRKFHHQTSLRGSGLWRALQLISQKLQNNLFTKQIPSHVLLQTGTNQWQQHCKENVVVELIL